MSHIESTAPYNMNRLLVKISLAATSILGAVILLLWIAAIWTGDGRLGGTGAILLIPAIVAGAVMAFIVQSGRLAPPQPKPAAPAKRQCA